jgi:hypothetical protein
MEANQKIVKLRLVRKSETAEWLVKVWVWVGGKWLYSELATYYTDDKGDAVATLSTMARQYSAQGYSLL